MNLGERSKTLIEEGRPGTVPAGLDAHGGERGGAGAAAGSAGGSSTSRDSPEPDPRSLELRPLPGGLRRR